VRALKYQLPSDPSLYVDVVDDEDVAMMLDEWREAMAHVPAGTSTGRLHIFVQWRDAQMPSGQPRPSADSEQSAMHLRHSSESQRHSGACLGGRLELVTHDACVHATCARSSALQSSFNMHALLSSCIGPSDRRCIMHASLPASCSGCRSRTSFWILCGSKKYDALQPARSAGCLTPRRARRWRRRGRRASRR